ncbi:MAG: TraM recognition domain-containing protein [Candidatus Dormibacteraeota bacterium]|uniref:TraM recognition domain-containing protein n=1 Tax=Candidatus Aeolococcus gillhamiae TaxID=3127015 RepID=A0A934K5X2_9BACT|nr:TraM recognition domain-containing protein [Candidatus Dormibacteraeota bacterium]
MSRPPVRSSGSRGPTGEPLAAQLLVPVGLVVAGMVAWLDAAALLSSLLSAHGVPALRGGWLIGPLHLLAHAANTGAAWTTPSAAPPTWLYLSTAVVLGTAVLVGVVVAWQWWTERRGRPSERRKRHGFLGPREANSLFGEPAARRQAAQLHPSLSASELRRRPIAELAIPLGLCEGTAVFASHELAVAVLAGMRQGKTTGLLARVALSHRGPLLYTTTKPDDLALFFQLPAGSRGRVLLFNPDDLGDLGTCAFDPVIGCQDPEAARLRAEAILARQRARGRDRGIDWALLAEKLLKYLLHAAALERAEGRESGMARVVGWAAAQDFDGAGVTRSLLRSPEASQWAELLKEMGRCAPETLYSIKINLHEALVCWEDPGLLRRVSPGSSAEVVDPAAVVRNGDRLLILARPGGHAVPLVTALVSAVVEAARQEARRALAWGGRLDPPLMLLLDEVTKVCPLPQMPELVTDCASQGIVPIYSLQSLEQGEEAWGVSRFQGMWSATNCHVVMGMISGERTLRAISDLSPTIKVEEQREGRDRHGVRLDPVVRWEPALTRDEVRAIAHHTAVVFCGPRPMRVRLPHVLSRSSEVRMQAEACRAAWLAWAAQRQGATA